MKKRTAFLILLAILIIGAAFRFYKLGTRTFVGDEFFDIDAIYGYHMTGEWQAWDFNTGAVEKDDSISDQVKTLRNERSWAYRWQVAQLLRRFPPTEYAVRSVSVFWGLVSVVVIYFVSKYFTRRKIVGLISAYLFAVNISAIELDRTLRMYSMLLPVFLLFAWFFYRFWEEKYEGNILFIKKIGERWRINLIWLFPMLAAGLLCIHLNQIAIVIIPVIFVYLLINVVIVFWQKKSCVNKYSITLSLLLLAAFIFFCFGLQNKVTSYTNTSVSTYVKLFRHNFKYFSLIAGNSAFFPLVVAIVFFGIFQAVKKLKLKKEILWISCCYFVPLLLAVFVWNYGAFDRFIFFIKSFEVILVGSGIYCVAVFSTDFFPKHRKKVFAITIAVMLILIPKYAYFFQKDNLYNKVTPKDELNYQDVFEYIKEHRHAGDVLITRNYRSYYFKGEDIKVFNFGGEFNPKKFTLEELENIVSSNSSGWIVIPERDEVFVKKGAIKYIKNNFSKINENNVLGEGLVYRWGNGS